MTLRSIALVAFACTVGVLVAASGITGVRARPFTAGYGFRGDTVLVSILLDARPPVAKVRWQKELGFPEDAGPQSWYSPMISGIAVSGDTVILAAEREHEIVVLNAMTGEPVVSLRSSTTLGRIFFRRFGILISRTYADDRIVRRKGMAIYDRPCGCPRRTPNRSDFLKGRGTESRGVTDAPPLFFFL